MKKEVRNRQDEIFMQEAVEEAVQSVRKGGGPFGAVLVYEDKVIARSGNTVTKDNDPTAHAEINVIRQGARKLKTFDLHGATLFASCEPCPMCLGAAYWANIDRVVFAATRKDAEQAGFRDSFIYSELSLPPEKRHLTHNHLPISERLKPFLEWGNNEEKIPY